MTKLLNLITSILPDLDSEALKSLLPKRLVKLNDWGEILLQDEAVDFIDSKDIEKFDKMQQRLKVEMTATTALRTEWLHVCTSKAMKAVKKRSTASFVNILGRAVASLRRRRKWASWRQ